MLSESETSPVFVLGEIFRFIHTNSKFKCRQRLRCYPLVKNPQRSSMYACGFLLAGASYPSNAIQSLKWYKNDKIRYLNCQLVLYTV